jgi:hypothetical protein
MGNFCIHTKDNIIITNSITVNPAPMLLGSTIHTMVVAAFGAVHGGFMMPIGWKRAALI